MMVIMERYTPSVERRWLFLLAGVLWSVVGVTLCMRAYGWLAPAAIGQALLLVLAGVVGGVALYRVMFIKIARKNITRIDRLRQREGVFAFQTARSYLLIAFMMSLGIALRHSAIPKLYLAVLYHAIGFGLLLASLHYYTHITK